MLHLPHGRPTRNCQGITRRTALKAGFLGLSGLTLPDLLRLRAQGAAARTDTACILLWLDGGPSQLESYDPKPEAPAEYRGPFGTIQTKLPGVRVSEVLPHHARHADKIALVRSLHHDNGDHFAAAHWMLTGRFGATAANQAAKYPGVGAYVAKVRGPNTPGLPPYVGLPAAHSVYIYPGYMGGAYLGPAYNPFDVNRKEKYLAANSAVQVRTPKWLSQFSAEAAASTRGRMGLLAQFDTLRRDLDQSGVMETMDRFQQEAMTMILGGKAREAFDIDQEEPRAADRYGTGPWGRYTLMARRLVEAGVTFVTVDMPHWDDHSRIEEGHGRKLRPLDQAVGALLDDLQERGLFERVLVVVMGEFGRTPRINTGQPGIPVPGRDHWGNAISAMLAGGGLRGGQVIGATNARAEHPVDRAMSPADLLATVYHVLGIDTRQTFLDHSGRPVTILDEGRPIAELI
jgi:hypothetical protein